MAKQMTTQEARERIKAFTGKSRADAYLYMRDLRAIVAALPDKAEAITFLNRVFVETDTIKETINGQVYHKEFQRLKTNAHKLAQQLQNGQTLR